MKAPNRGIVIVSILVLTLLATFFLGALIQMNPSRLRRNVHDEKRDRASMAARAGVDYVLNRFKSDAEWSGDSNTKTVEMEDLVIREDHGNVLGWIRTEDGNWAGFRVRFNAQDGDGGFDNRSNPTYPINNEAISLNNLMAGNLKSVPKATANGVAVVDHTDPLDPNAVMKVPANALALQVEGLVGPDLQPDDPKGLAQSRGETVRTVEGIYAISEVVSGSDESAVLSAGGQHSSITVGEYADPLPGKFEGVLSLQSGTDNTAVIRAKGELKLERGQGSEAYTMFDPDEDAEVRTPSADPFNPRLADGSYFSGGVEDNDATFQKIEWERVKDTEQADSLTLPGGVYIFTEGDKDSGRSLADNVKYFDMSWAEYKTALMDPDPNIPRPSTMPDGFLDMVELDKESVSLTRNDSEDNSVSQEKRDVITISGDVVVDDPNEKGLTIVPERGARQKAGEESGETAPDQVTPITTEQLDTLAASDPQRVTDLGTLIMDHIVANYQGPRTGPGGSIAWDWGNQTNLVFSYDPNVGFVSGVPGQPATGARFLLTEILTGGTILFPGGDINPLPAGMSLANSPPPPGTDVTVIPQYKFDPADFLASLDGVESLYEGTIAGGGGTHSDPLHIPDTDPETGEPISLDGGEADRTVPQDIEVVFKPKEGNDTAFIRSETDIFLGTHISGEGGGVISNQEVHLVGFGINIDARTQQNQGEIQERTGVAIYGKEGVNISTYDERRNNYWDAEIKGAVFTEGNISIRLGEEKLAGGGDDPPWGLFSYEGAMIALGNAKASGGGGIGNAMPDPPPRHSVTNKGGQVDLIGRGIRLFYNPSYLAPYLEKAAMNPTFSALSVVER
ncbi:MAG: hypothetical protein WC314_07445 [Vulcanimicrobiota bacterium]